MNARRLMVELLLALILAWFAMAVDKGYAMASVSNQPCEKGLPALSDPPTDLQDGGARADASVHCLVDPNVTVAVDWSVVIR